MEGLSVTDKARHVMLASVLCNVEMDTDKCK